MGALTGWIWLKIGIGVAGCCECGNEPLDSKKRGELLDFLRTCQLLKKDSAPWRWLYRRK